MITILTVGLIFVFSKPIISIITIYRRTINYRTLCFLTREHPISALCELNYSFPWEDRTNGIGRGKYEGVGRVLGREWEVAGQTWLGDSPDYSFVDSNFFQTLTSLTRLNNWMNRGPIYTKEDVCANVWWDYYLSRYGTRNHYRNWLLLVSTILVGKNTKGDNSPSAIIKHKTHLVNGNLVRLKLLLF